jgi:hypothetical protein
MKFVAKVHVYSGAPEDKYSLADFIVDIPEGTDVSTINKIANTYTSALRDQLRAIIAAGVDEDEFLYEPDDYVVILSRVVGELGFSYKESGLALVNTIR